jgi:hypothetical protein
MEVILEKSNEEVCGRAGESEELLEQQEFLRHERTKST